jgi:hypothetical protein
MRSWILAPVLILTFFSASATPLQSTLSRGPQQNTGTALIEGMVVQEDTGQPVSGAQINLAGGMLIAIPPVTTAGGTAGTAPVVTSIVPPPGATVIPPGANAAPSRTTGSDGRFSFTGLVAASYRLTVIANGFARTEYAQRGSGQGRVLYLTSGQQVRDLVIRLAPNGSVAGRIVDEKGRPATSASVYIVQIAYSAQGQSLQSVGEGSSDDRGEFRIFGIPPGQYFVLAGSPPRPLPPVLSGGTRQPAPRYDLIHYPNATELSQASPVQVRSSNEAFVDMRLTRQEQVYHVRGRIVNAGGEALPPNVNVTLGYRFLSSTGSYTSGRPFNPATGTFDIQNVPPGNYMVQGQLPILITPSAGPIPPAPGPIDAAASAARQAEQASRLFGQTPIRVVNSDVDGVLVTMSSGATRTGRVEMQGQAGAIPNIERMRLTLQPLNPIGGISPPVALPITATGTFQVVGLRAGDYRVQFSAAGQYVKSIRFGGMDIASGFRFDGITAGTFEVVLGSGTGQIAGVVVDTQSRPVSGIQIVAVPAQRERTDLFRVGVTDASGKFTLGVLPPGDYRVFSWESIPNGAYYDPNVIRQFETMGTAARVSENSRQDISVKLIPAN